MWHIYQISPGFPVTLVTLFPHVTLCIWVLFFFKFFFFMWTIFKLLLNLLQYHFCSVFWFFWLQCMWDLSILTRNQSCTPCIERWSLNCRGPPGKNLYIWFSNRIHLFLIPHAPMYIPKLYFPPTISWWNRGGNVSHQRFEVLCALGHEVLGKSKKGLLGNED